MLRFKGGFIKGERNISSLRTDSLLPTRYGNHYYVLLQFDDLPDLRRRKELAAQGIHLYDYIPDHAYLAEVRDSLSTSQLKKYSVSSLYRMPSSFKIADRLQQDPESNLRDPDKLIAVRYFGTLYGCDAHAA